MSDKDFEKRTITKKQSDALTQIVMSRTHRLVNIERAKIILFSSELKQDKDIAHGLGIIPRTVRKWRERWLANEASNLYALLYHERKTQKQETVILIGVCINIVIWLKTYLLDSNIFALLQRGMIN